MGYAITRPVDLTGVASAADVAAARDAVNANVDADVGAVAARTDVATSTRAPTSATTKIKSIQRGMLTIPAAVQSAEAAIATVVLASTHLDHHGSISADDTVQPTYVYFNGASAVGAAKGKASGASDTIVRYQITEWV